MKRFLIILFISNLFTFSLFSEELRFLTHELKPFTWRDTNDNTLKGIAYDLCRETINRMGYSSSKIKIYPFIRALKMVETEDNYVIFHVARTSEREHNIKWVGPIISSNVYFYKLTKNHFKLNTLSDLKKLKQIGVGRGNASEAILIKEGFTNLYSVNNEMNAILMLASGRVDVVPVGELVINEMMQKADIDKTLIEKTNIKLTESILYMGFSKNISDNEIKKWQEMFDIIKKEIYADLYKKYIDN